MPGNPSTDRVLEALRAAGSRIRAVRYRTNRSVLLSVSEDGLTLNTHVCFREAPRHVLDAVALFLRARRGSPEQARALDVIRGWEGASRGIEMARRVKARRSPPSSERRAGAQLRPLFERFNGERFGGQLPDIPLRVSRRMTRTLGTIAYATEGEARVVREIAISADLLRPANAAQLADTLLHEMAHAEAWIRHGHRGHGKVWRAIAARVGCRPRALARTRIERAR